MAGECLVVYMRELPARVFEEELALNRVYPGKDIHKQDRDPQQNHASVLMNQDVPVRNEELELRGARSPRPAGWRSLRGQCCRSSARFLFNTAMVIPVSPARLRSRDRARPL